MRVTPSSVAFCTMRVHALAARDALQQRDLHWRLAFNSDVRQDLRRDALAGAGPGARRY